MQCEPLDAKQVSRGWTVRELERLLASRAYRDEACRDTRKLLNPCHIRFSIFRELSIRCRIFDTGFIPAWEGFKDGFTAIEELDIAAWETRQRTATARVARADLDLIKACEDIKVTDMDAGKAVYANGVLERKGI